MMQHVGVTIAIDDLSDIEQEVLVEALDAAGLAEEVTFEQPTQPDDKAHGLLLTATALIAVSKSTLPVLAAWFLGRAAPQAKKETITISYPDGKVEKRVIEYHRGMPISDLLRRLSEALG